jgi:dipeptidyl aminopeptidase/acylaminoacyl peptidase
MHGAKDAMIGVKQSERLKDAIVSKFGSGAVEYHVLANGDH